jgi:hypothetical protein
MTQRLSSIFCLNSSHSPAITLNQTDVLPTRISQLCCIRWSRGTKPEKAQLPVPIPPHRDFDLFRKPSVTRTNEPYGIYSEIKCTPPRRTKHKDVRPRNFRGHPKDPRKYHDFTSEGVWLIWFQVYNCPIYPARGCEPRSKSSI